jgi:hypothetical protein
LEVDNTRKVNIHACQGSNVQKKKSITQLELLKTTQKKEILCKKVDQAKTCRYIWQVLLHQQKTNSSSKRNKYQSLNKKDQGSIPVAIKVAITAETVTVDTTKKATADTPT